MHLRILELIIKYLYKLIVSNHIILQKNKNKKNTSFKFENILFINYNNNKFFLIYQSVNSWRTF